MHSFKIFIPVKKTSISLNRIVYLLAMTLFLPYAYELFILKRDYDSISAASRLCFGISVISGIISFCLSMLRSSKKKALSGKLEGNIVFENDEITIDNEIYPLTKIDKISFPYFSDYIDRKEDFTNSNYNGGISQGVDNKVVLFLNDGKEIIIQFQLERRYQIREMRPELVHYHNEGKLHFLHLTEVLGIEDYNAIQIFKKSLSEGGNVKSY